MDWLYHFFCRHRANEYYKAKQHNIVLQIELEKKQLRIQQLMRTMKNMTEANYGLWAKLELQYKDIEAKLQKIDANPPELLTEALNG